MLDNIIQSIEEIEKQILEVAETGQGAGDAVDALGLSHMKISSAGVIAILDMLMDGITPVNNEIITSMLGVCEAQKRFLYALSGDLSSGAESMGMVEAKTAPDVTPTEETEEDAAKAFEEPTAKTEADAAEEKVEATPETKEEKKPAEQPKSHNTPGKAGGLSL